MSFDQSTRNRLANFVAKARTLLSEEFTRQLQQEYGLDPDTGDAADLNQLPALDDARRETARILRATLTHYLAGQAKPGAKARQEMLDRIVREQAFTVLNRLCALRMAEARGLLIESVAQGYQSRGFQLYARLAGPALGETGQAYRAYLFSVFDEFGVDLPVLFDRFSPQGRLFPREGALLNMLALINAPDIEALWAEDETIGWVYQYFNSKEERQAMRAASQAPRNSRELAVRNQFFTPRYVVEFLTDNTLGRIWYEMTQGHTALVDQCRYLVRRPTEILLAEGQPSLTTDTPADLSQEDLLKQPVYVAHRPLKDPREILMLDPACGSMHFGLYAFDLYERIYEEAWEMQNSGQWTAPITNNQLLITDYPTLEELRRALPRLIVEHNIHGIDIDPRAVQIAALSLWLRAQKSWHAKGLKAAERPAITRSNIVCAEPMPGDTQLLNEFLSRHLSTTPEDRLLAALVRQVFEAMKLAGEAGSLLKIEEEIADTLAEAKRKWQARPKYVQARLFGTQKPQQPELGLDVTGIADAAFWDEAENGIYAALRAYAEQAENGGGYARRLFANDAARGFAFIDLCRKRYDVVLMNPPFGETATRSAQFLDERYIDSRSDILQAFVERAHGLLPPSGYVGAITSRTPFFNGQSQTWRERLVFRLFVPSLVADFGYGVLEAAVDTAAYVMRKLTVLEDERLTIEIFNDLINIGLDQAEMFSLNKYMQTRQDKPKKHQALYDLTRLVKSGFVEIAPGHERSPRYRNSAKKPSVNDSSNTNQNVIICFRLIDQDDKGTYLLSAIRGEQQGLSFVTKYSNLSSIPGTPLAYWISSRTSELFHRVTPFQFDDRMAQQGLSTKNDFRYLRNWWEVLSVVSSADLDAARKSTLQDENWYRVCRGASYTDYLADISQVVNWANDGRELEADLIAKYPYLNGDANWVLHRECNYFQTGLTFSRRARRFAPKPVPAGCLFTETGQMLFANESDLLWISAYLNSDIMRSILGLLAPPRKIELNYVARLPVPQTIPATIAAELEVEQRNLVQNSLILATGDESSVYFITAREFLPYAAKPVSKESLINDLVCAILDISSRDKENLLRQLGSVTGLAEDQNKYLGDLGENDSEDEGQGPASIAVDWSRLSLALGCIVGRWDIRYAIGQKPVPELPNPFASLPVCPPGMLQNANGLSAAPGDVPSDYPLRISWSGILVDDDGHKENIVARVREALQVIWGERWEAIEQEACEILVVKSLRDYFRKPALFFAEHLKRYNKGRRQAPIYWPLSTPSGSYTLWLYYHRLNDQILYTAVNDFVEPKLKEVSGELANLRRQANRSSKDEDRLEELSDLERELGDFRAELLRLAKIWKPNLNDGVQITAAPLWALFQHRPWQKKLKETWAAFEAGEYDWAHLAYSMWPDRVREKCKSDKSLAIAHDLEALYVEKPGAKKKATRKKKAVEPEEELFEEE